MRVLNIVFTGNLNLFPNAIQIVGFDINVPPYGEWVRHDWREQIPYEISTYIEVVPTPGHTAEDLTVVVRRTRLLCSASPNSRESTHAEPTPLLLSRGGGRDDPAASASASAGVSRSGEGDGVGVAVAGDTFECEADLDEPQLWQSLSTNRELQQMYRQAILSDGDIEFIVPGHGAPFRVKPSYREQPVVDLVP